ncbi:MAG: hypothetical protein IT450_23980, partial [Phycisphaerales bacterium]|nr:hypothetical protein [Phycisphaerales bacterium]
MGRWARTLLTLAGASLAMLLAAPAAAQSPGTDIDDLWTSGDAGFVDEFADDGTLDPRGRGRGACCVETPSGRVICVITTADRCEGAGGVYHGDGTRCTPGLCSDR